MARRPNRPCRALGCRELHRNGNGYCDTHACQAVNWKSDKERGTRQQRGYGAKWQRIREEAMKRDRGICQPCKQQGRITPATAVDHIVPLALNGPNELGNAQAICEDCHKAKTGREGAQGRRARGGGG